jgi:signal peptidase I
VSDEREQSGSGSAGSSPPQAEHGSSPRVEGRRSTAGRQETRAATKKKRSTVGMVVEVVVIVAAAFAIALLVQWLLIKPFTIHQVSMQPTLMEGDRILINRLTYHFRDPQAGDVVVFNSPLNKDEDLVKRVVAVEGDRVAIRDGSLYVNDVAQEEPYLLEQDFRGEVSEMLVPAEQVFVLGDNRNNSGDSRIFGPIPRDSIIGSGFVIYWPIRHWGGL